MSFVSDGASVLLGKKNGVAKKLKDKYPLIFSWHCMNHRLELAVNDSLKDVSATNHFKCFIDSLYVLYNASPKNQTELREICHDLDVLFLKIGRVLSVRWVASSWRAVNGVSKYFLHFISICILHPMIPIEILKLRINTKDSLKN